MYYIISGFNVKVLPDRVRTNVLNVLLNSIVYVKSSLSKLTNLAEPGVYIQTTVIRVKRLISSTN